MSTDYYVTIKRKSDDKQIGMFIANQLKTIMDSQFSEVIHCDHRRADNVRFTPDELQNVENQAYEELKKKTDEIVKNNMMIALAQNGNVKREIEEDISYIKEDIDDLRYVIASAAGVYGMIACLVEDEIRGKDAAYEYNAADLPRKKGKYGNGEEYEYSASLWCSDVYCEITASY